MSTIKALSTLVVGVAILGVASGKNGDQSEAVIPHDEGPMEFEENGVEQRRMETPEVVLQLKYDKGELNKIYLAQFRKETKSWMPTVTARQSLCADLCHAGLGGPACGGPCASMLPVGLQQALSSDNHSNLAVFGEPRVSVCPALCLNHLGYPLCNCEGTQDAQQNHIGPEMGAAEHTIVNTADWHAVCSAFCQTDSYVLSGCPACSQQPPQPTVLTSGSVEAAGASSRVLTTAAGWGAWCDVQCRQGHGGAACNCDRAPF